MTGVRVLIVDDHASNRMLLMSLLDQWGCRYQTAVDGESAPALLGEAAIKGDSFRIALIDHQMPGMDGLELGRRIKGDPRLEATMMVMMASLSQKGDAAIIDEIGFDGYLAKPVRQSHLHGCLSQLLGRTAAGERAVGIVAGRTVAESAPCNARILLAEDNIVNQKVAQGLLKNLGYRADVVANGLEAVKALELINYDLVLMDCQMPEMDGFEATSLVRNAASKVLKHEVPVIAMTANAMKGDREHCLAIGMSDYLAKPVKPNELRFLLEKWLSRKEETGRFRGECLDGTLKPAEPSSRPRIFDLEGMLDQMMNDEEFAIDVISCFLVDTPLQIEILRKVLAQGDVAGAVRQAHTIKGASAYIGGVALCAVAARMEQSARAGDLNATLGQLAELESEFTDLKKETLNWKPECGGAASQWGP